MSKSALLMDIYRALLTAFGDQHWWPGETPFEVMVGAVLTQRTNWGNVEKAIGALKAAGLMTPESLARTPPERLEPLVRPAGYYRQKTARLLRLVKWLMERTGGDLAALERLPTEALRQELLGLSGIGPETADSILLYALGRPTFVVDAYTKRVMARHELIDSACTYEELKAFFESNLPDDLALFKDYHAQLVVLGKRYCRTVPLCASCPLHPLLGDPAPDEDL
jgi:endonuclease-3 related protein